MRPNRGRCNGRSLGNNRVRAAHECVFQEHVFRLFRSEDASLARQIDDAIDHTHARIAALGGHVDGRVAVGCQPTADQQRRDLRASLRVTYRRTILSRELASRKDREATTRFDDDTVPPADDFNVVRAPALPAAIVHAGVRTLGMDRDILHRRALRARMPDADRAGMARNVDVDPLENVIERDVRLLLAPGRLLLASRVEPGLCPDVDGELRPVRIVEAVRVVR